MKYFAIMILLFVGCNKGGSTDPTGTLSTTSQTTTSTSSAGTQSTTSGTPSTTPGTTTVNPTDSFSTQFMKLINDHRHSLGLGELVNDPEMARIAQGHSDEMANGSVAFGHTGFSTRCSEAIKAMGSGNMCGENVAEGQQSPQAVFTAWMNSPGHRANIEQARYTHSGFGYQKNNSGVYYWTHLFLEVK